MTLYRQLFSGMLILLIILIFGVFLIQFNTTRDFLRLQQQNELDNTINSVGMALSPYLDQQDMIAAESLINATFDGGFYSSVTLEVFDPKQNIEREYQLDIEGVPDFFTQLITIKPLSQSRVLTNGWLQVAELSVTTNTSFAYLKLWQASVQLFWGFIATCLLGTVMVSIFLRRVLTPLTAIQTSAKAMSNNEFRQPLVVPEIRELKDVVMAFNHMSQQLKAHINHQAQEADKLRIRAYQDPVSGLANRPYLITKLDTLVEHGIEGGVALLRADFLADCYERLGYEAGDDLTVKLAKSLQELASDEITIARLNHAEFMLLLPHNSNTELTQLGRAILNKCAALQSDPLDISPLNAAIGLVVRSEDDTTSSLLAQADNAVNQARQQASEHLFLIDSSDHTLRLGKQQWKRLVDHAISHNQITINLQAATDIKGKVLHQEAFSAIYDGQKTYSASQFLGAIEQLQAGPEFDRHVTAQIVAMLEEGRIHGPNQGPIAINITQSSINDTGFMRWLGTLLKSKPHLSGQLLFELPEISFLNQLDNIELLCDIIHRNGFDFGIDNYGHNFSSVSYLHRFKPAYVKLDFAYTQHVDDQLKADVLASITRNAHTLGIITIASRVETTEQKDKLTALMIKGFQGYGLHPQLPQEDE
ncbi:diguanylate phosphodiesterase [Photobacterium jeanii]|uniref:Diguanylate phosphodiesterase n=1 Tax=Photobacterium jeanii TaxID=858640 RepID=A0A178K1C1_9GAMM|nr:EAL domain-containing protein [Photobacterium jeanii]OAN11129.1 diguanylate phosphodiesterase [Photobacterium jeanii]PST90647.1 HAMP domain-containing protein [Photobacterium jeanii]